MINQAKAQNSASLSGRDNINVKYSKHDLNDWIFSLLSLKKDDVVFDICCGRGKQACRFAENCPEGMVYANDISQESLDVIDEKKIKNIRTILMSLDSMPNAPLKEDFFDIAHVAYGLYYAKDALPIINKIFSLVKRGGIFIVVGPTDENNHELYDLIEQIYKIDKDIIFTSRDFMNKVVVPESKKLFSQVDKFYFNNQIIYPNADSVYTYFKSSTMYREKYDKQLRELINNHFFKNKEFIISKKAMAMIARKN